MKKIELAKLNKANKDIWALIDAGLKTKNFAILEKNLKRLHSLQAYYIDLLNFNDYEIVSLQNDLNAESAMRQAFEKDFFEGVAKRNGNYELLKDRIDEIFK